MNYSVTLERGSDGRYLAWVHELPGCFARGATRDDAIANAGNAVASFHDWLRAAGEAVAEGGAAELVVAEEVDSLIEADEDTEVLLAPDHAPLSKEDWQKTKRWLTYSRKGLLRALAVLADDRLDQQIEGRERTIREQLVHIAFVELMYAAWTFDLRSRDGLTEFLNWTRSVAVGRLQLLAENEAASLTYAEWAGAPRPEPWTPRKAARRLLWHELLHLPEIT